MTQGNLKYQFEKLNIAEKLIAVNVVVFIVNRLVPFLLGMSSDTITQWFELPKDFFAFLMQPWSIVTYAFFHGGFGHLFWNMLLIYYVGRIFLNLFDARRFLTVYFLGAMLGGAIFVLGYNIFPAFYNVNASLIGASAAASAVLLFVCTYLPNQEVKIIFFNVKLWHIGVFTVIMDLVQIPTGNAGGHLSHLGGALLGYLYAKQLAKGIDIGAGFARFVDSVINYFDTSKTKTSLKTVHRATKVKSTASTNNSYSQQTHQKKVDAILDKISKSGYESLSKGEKDFLFKAGKES